MNALKNLPSIEEMQELAKDMYKTATRSTYHASMMPHGMLIRGNSDVVDFLGPRAMNLTDRLGNFALIRSIANPDEKVEYFYFVCGVMWGYTLSEESVASLWSENDYELLGMSKEMVAKCVETICEESDAEDPPEDGYNLHKEACWVTGCFVGRYFLNINSLNSDKIGDL